MLALVRFTHFLCRIPDNGGAGGPIGEPVLCSGKIDRKSAGIM
jgi:hypothetical protein